MKNSILLSVMIFVVNVTVSQSKFEQVFNNNAKSSREDIKIEFKDQAGNTGYLPISVLKGKNKGTVFTVLAGVHGYEYPPIIATQNILKEVNVEKLNGTLIIIPLANIASFFGRTPFVNPQDNKNLNNAFPGDKNGTITEKIAHFITKEIIPVTDIFLDIHGGDACEDLVPFVCYYNNVKNPEKTVLAKKLSENSGFEYVISYEYTLSETGKAKYAFKQAVQEGKTALSIECGKLGNVQEENVKLIEKGVYNMLATMNMYANGSKINPNIKYGTNQVYLKSAVRGIFYSKYKAGDMVKKDEIVGYTTNEFGAVIEEYKAPKNGMILYKLATPPVNINDTVMCISSVKNVE